MAREYSQGPDYEALWAIYEADIAAADKLHAEAVRPFRFILGQPLDMDARQSAYADADYVQAIAYRAAEERYHDAIAQAMNSECETTRYTSTLVREIMRASGRIEGEE